MVTIIQTELSSIFYFFIWGWENQVAFTFTSSPHQNGFFDCPDGEREREIERGGTQTWFFFNDFFSPRTDSLRKESLAYKLNGFIKNYVYQVINNKEDDRLDKFNKLILGRTLWKNPLWKFPSIKCWRMTNLLQLDLNNKERTKNPITMPQYVKSNSL